MLKTKENANKEKRKWILKAENCKQGRKESMDWEQVTSELKKPVLRHWQDGDSEPQASVLTLGSGTKEEIKKETMAEIHVKILT